MFSRCTITFLTDLVTKLRPLTCLPEDWIIRYGTIGHEMFLLMRGKVAVIDMDSS